MSNLVKAIRIEKTADLKFYSSSRLKCLLQAIMKSRFSNMLQA